MTLLEIKSAYPKMVNFHIKRQSDLLEKFVDEFRDEQVFMKDGTIFSLNGIDQWDITFPPDPYPNEENL